MPYFWLKTIVMLASVMAHASEPTPVPAHDPLSIVHSEVFPTKIAPGASAEVRIQFTLAPGYHAYLEQFQLKLVAPNGTQLTHPDIQPISEFVDPVSKRIKKGVHDEGLLKSVIETPADLPSGSTELVLNLVYQACTKKFCLFPKTLTVRIPFTSIGEVVKSDDSVAEHDSAMTALRSLDFSNARKNRDWSVFALVFVAGILTSFTPCIFPMIPITLAILGARQARSRRRSVIITLTYVLGIASTYSLLGVIAASTGALFGSLLGHPLVAGGLAILFFIMALSMFGLFELQAPAWVRDGLSRRAVTAGPAGAFLAGLLAGVVASPCVGPVLVAILAYVARTQDLLFGFGLLFVFAFGMGQLFLLLGTFSHLWQRFPRSGPWMNIVKYLFGACLFGLSIYYVWPLLPKMQIKPAFETTQAIKWRTFSAAELKQAQALRTPVIIDFYADWCVACKELEKLSFPHKDVQTLAEQFIWLRYDATTTPPEFTELQKKYQILGLPHIAFHDSQGRHLSELTLTGFEGGAEFAQRLRAVLSAKSREEHP